MSRKLLLATAIALSSCMSFAAGESTQSTSSTANTQSTPAEMPKDNWLSSMTPLLPDLICKSFMQDADLKKRFDEIKMTYEQCVSLIPASSTKCQNQLYSNIPDKIDNAAAATWGKSLGECIGKDFAEKYLVPK